MPVSSEQWRASVGSINAGRSRALARLSCPTKRSTWKGGLLWCLLVMVVCGGIWLERAVAGKVGRGLKKWFFLVAVAVVYREQLINLSKPSSHSPRPSSNKHYWSGRGGYLNLAFHVAVLCALLSLSGDVEANPGPFTIFPLVPANLNRLIDFLKDVEERWEELAVRMHMVIFFPNNLKGVLSTWLTIHNPKWEQLMDVLCEMGYTSLAKQISSGNDSISDVPILANSNHDDDVTGCKSQEDAKRLFFEAMEKGYVTSQSVVIILIGIAGSGKSSFKRVVLNQPAEEKRVSTALTEATIRNISISRAIVEGSESVDWEVVTPEELLTMVADAIKKVVPQQSINDDVTKTHAEPSKDGKSSTAVNIPSPISKTGKDTKTHAEPSKDGESVTAVNIPNPISKTGKDTKTHAELSKNGGSSTAVNTSSPTSMDAKKHSKDGKSLTAVNIPSPISKGTKTHAELNKDGESSTAVDISSPISKTGMDAIEPTKEMSSDTREKALTEKNLSEDIELNDSIIQLISNSKASQKSLLDVHWVYIIDTGGQPQFLQLLPAFVKNISTCVCFVRLDQNLDDKPPILFFDKEGKQCGDSYPSERTNLQVIESCVRTIYSRCCLNSDAPPNFLVVGTHQDEYERIGHPETIEMKNECLINHLSTLLEENLTFFEVGNNSFDADKLIFPLNCKTPSKQDRSVAAEFRKCVMTHCREPQCKIPLAWFVLEQYVRQYAIKNNADYIKKSTCWVIAKKLNMRKETFEAALSHLLKLSIFRCYSSLPNLIFCDTQVILLKLTELVQYSFQLQKAIVRGVSGEERSFKNEGIVSLTFLSRFPKFYSSTFTPECFLKILRELLAIADLETGKYFLPCLVKELAEKDASKYRGSSNSLSTLLLRLEGGCIPNGLFTSLISSLKNYHQWKLNYKNRKPACLFQNCVMFGLPGQLPGSVTLIASFEYIEVHLVCAVESKLDSVCTKVYADIKSGLEASWKVLYSGRISFEPAFFCSRCISSSSVELNSNRNHYASISSCGLTETCSLDCSQGLELPDSKIRWLKNINYYEDHSQCAPTVDQGRASILMQSQALNVEVDYSQTSLYHQPTTTIRTEDMYVSDLVQAYAAGIPETHLAHLDKSLDWDNKGVEKDLCCIAKSMVKWEEELTTHLKLTQTDVSDIKEEYSKSPTLQRQAVLRKWKSYSEPYATFNTLLETFVAARRPDCAKAVCKTIRKKNPLLARQL